MEDKADIFVKPYLVNPLCFRKKKRKQSELIFHIQREARLGSQHPLTLPTSPVRSAIWIMVRPHSGLDVHERQGELPGTEL